MRNTAIYKAMLATGKELVLTWNQLKSLLKAHKILWYEEIVC